MPEYHENGARLGRLINSLEKRVYTYRPNQGIEILDDPPMLSGDPVLSGLVLHVRESW